MQSESPLSGTPRFAHRPIQHVLIRANGPLFYSVSAASLLEALVPLYAARMRHFFEADASFDAWLREAWLPCKHARALHLRHYVETTWPELEWPLAFEHCTAAAEAEGGLGPHKPSAAHEALAACVASAETGLFYRALARWAEDSRLRELAARAALEEIDSFRRFRAAYDARARRLRLGVACAWRTVRACVQSARDLHVALAFDAVRAHCSAHVPFPVLDYHEFLRRMRAVVERHGEVGTREWLLFAPWRTRARIARVTAAEAFPVLAEMRSAHANA